MKYRLMPCVILAVLAVLAYRTISYWLPILPGAIAYFRLRHTVGDWRQRDQAPQGITGSGSGVACDG